MTNNDLIKKILSVLDLLKRDISAIEIVRNSTRNEQLNREMDKALNILNISRTRIENIFQQTKDEKEILSILELITKRSEELTSLVLKKTNDSKNGVSEPVETVKIQPSKADFSEYVTPVFDRKGFDKAIKDAMVEDEKFNQRAREIMAGIMAENAVDEKADTEPIETEEVNTQATRSLRSWLNSNENS